MNAGATDRPAGPRPPILVLGVGSSLRSDDAAGRCVVEAVAARRLPGVECRLVHQLTPELAADAAGRDLLVVVDASTAVREVTVAEVTGAAPGGALSHHLGVARLLDLVDHLGVGDRPAAITVEVPVEDLGLGFELAPRTAAAVQQAAAHVVARCGRRSAHAVPEGTHGGGEVRVEPERRVRVRAGDAPGHDRHR